MGEVRPSPRAFHASAMILQEIAGSTTECEMIGLFVLGGLGPNKDGKVVALNDAWYLNFKTGKWRALPLGGYSVPMWGVAVCPAGWNTFVLHGGGSTDNSLGPKNTLAVLTLYAVKQGVRGRVLEIPVKGDDYQTMGKRLFHWAGMLRIEPTNIRVRLCLFACIYICVRECVVSNLHLVM